ncbi:MAG: hypothetical protein ACYDAA_11290 [Syntrophales bacterium]
MKKELKGVAAGRTTAVSHAIRISDPGRVKTSQPFHSNTEESKENTVM